MNKSTGYKQPSYITQSWWVIKYAFESWLEWMEAKKWAKEVRPVWLYLATDSGSEETRDRYRRMILDEYKKVYEYEPN